MDVFTRGSADETWNWILRKTVNGSVQKWNHPLKTVETKKSGGQKKGTVEFGKMFGYDIRKTVDTCKSNGGKKIY